MRILIVTPRQSRMTGNWVAATRQQMELESLGHTVRIVDVPESGRELEEITESFAPDVVTCCTLFVAASPGWHAAITINSLTYAALAGDHSEWSAKLQHVPSAPTFVRGLRSAGHLSRQVSSNAAPALPTDVSATIPEARSSATGDNLSTIAGPSVCRLLFA